MAIVTVILLFATYITLSCDFLNLFSLVFELLDTSEAVVMESSHSGSVYIAVRHSACMYACNWIVLHSSKNTTY